MTGTLLVIQDSLDFGGHEAMFLRFLPALIEARAFNRIAIRYPAGNTRLRDRLAPFAGAAFEAQGWGFAKRGGEPYLADFRRRYGAACRALLAAEKPSAVLLLQGRIENCAVPMLAAPRDQFVVSYVPMAHRMAEIGRAAVPGDMIRRRLYGRPNRFIVPGRSIVAQIESAGGRAPVMVVDNVVDPPPRPDRDAARAALGLAANAKVALFLGRLDVRQKGLDTLAAAIRAQAARLKGWTFLIVGAGEGAATFDALARDLAGRVDLRSIPWTDRPQDPLTAADLLLMPSRWEGVPLVMLEAMTYGVPILGSGIDVFRDYLPAANRIDFAAADLADAMARTIAPDHAAAFRHAAGARIAETGLARSSARFVEALIPERIAA
jgi:glycosyltransferase involved in cell wall biosynthesis